MKDHAPNLEMPNNMKPENYPQKFVKAPMSMHPLKYNDRDNDNDKHAPSLQQMMATMEKR